MNRAIRQRDLNVIYVTGPGHGGPALVASICLEGTYSEVYSAIGQNEDGLRALFRQFSFPGGFPATSRRRLPAQFMRAASSAIR
jgi:xylulose-5-phosphate/fructose-6-phosphate phosphoketolase